MKPTTSLQRGTPRAGLVFILTCGLLAAAAQATPPWPMVQGGKDHLGRSAFQGPAANTIRWTYHWDGGAAINAPVVGSQGVYFTTALATAGPSSGKALLVSVGFAGAENWRFWDNSASLSDMNYTMYAVPGVDPDENIYFSTNKGSGVSPNYSRMIKVSPVGAYVSCFYHGSNSVNSDITLSSAGNVYYSCGTAYAIAKDTTKYSAGSSRLPAAGLALSSDEATVYIGTGSTGTKRLLAVNTSGMTPKWYIEPIPAPTLDLTGVPLVDGTKIYYATKAGLYGVQDNGASGTVLWTRSDIVLQNSGGAFCYGGLALGTNGILYAGDSTGKIHAVDPTAATVDKWSVTLSGSGRATAPVLDSDGYIYVARGNTISKIQDDVASGTVLWTQTVTGNVQGLALDLNVLYATTDAGYLYAIGSPISLPVERPTFSEGGGIYTGTQSVTIDCPTSGATIRFTTDGSDPADNLTGYAAPVTVTVDHSLTLKAKAYKTGMDPSATASADYTIVDFYFREDYNAATWNTRPEYKGFSTTTPYNTFMVDNSTVAGTLDFYSNMAGLNYGTYILNYEFSAASGYQLSAPVVQLGGFANDQLNYGIEYLSTSPDNITWTTVSTSHALNGAQTLVDNLTADPAYTYVPTLYVRVQAKVFYPHAWPDIKVDWLQVVADKKVSPTAQPTFTPDGGSYASPASVTIACGTDNATIRYTTDGSDPSETNGTIIASGGTALVNQSQTLKAKAWSSELDPSSLKIANYLLTNTNGYNRPEAIPYGNGITVDGDLSDWAGAQWAALDQVYTGSPTDISEAYYAAKWGANGTKVYVAVKVKDTSHYFTNLYTASTARDAIELYIHTNGAGPVDYSADKAEAQNYSVGITSDNHSAVWTGLGSLPLPAAANFQAAGREDGQWLYYEAAITPFDHFGELTGGSNIPTTLHGNDVIGLDVCAVGHTAGPLAAYTGYKSENLLQWKYNDYTKIGLHTLLAPSYTAADLSAMLAAMDATSTSSNWNPLMDLDGDGEITSTDLSILLANMP